MRNNDRELSPVARESIINLFRKHMLPTLIGTLLISYGVFSIFSSEVNHLKTTQSLLEMKDLVSLDRPPSDLATFKNKIIHCSGPLDIKVPAVDKDFKVSRPCAVLKRIVKMYQWMEIEGTNGNMDSGSYSYYSYEKVWSSKLVDSNSFYIRFGHENLDMAHQSMTFYAEGTKACGFLIARELVDRVSSFKKVIIQEHEEDQITEGEIFIGNDPTNPEIGDLKISYKCGISAVRTSEAQEAQDPEESDVVSIIGKVNEDSLESWPSSLGIQLGFLHMGHVTFENMVKRELGDQMINSWLSRFLGFFIHFVGFSFAEAFINDFATVHSHQLRHIFVNHNKMKIKLASSLGLSISSVVLVWIVYRPLLVIILLLLVILTLFLAARHAPSRWRP